MTIGKGDQVSITMTGTVESEHSVHDACHKIKDANGRWHYIYLASGDGTHGSGCKVTLTKKAENFTEGKAYEDADGDVFIRTADGWVDQFCTRRRDGYPSRPLVLSEAVKRPTEAELTNALKTAIRANGPFGVSVHNAGDLVRHLQSAGVVKVAGK